MTSLHRASLVLLASMSLYAVTSCEAFWAAAPAALSTASTIAQAIARDRGQPLDIHETDALEVALRELSAARKALDEAERNADERSVARSELPSSREANTTRRCAVDSVDMGGLAFSGQASQHARYRTSCGPCPLGF